MQLPLRAAPAALLLAAICAGLAAGQDAAPPAAPDGAEDVRTDRLGDPLPPGAIARLGTDRLMADDRVMLVRFLDDELLLTAAGRAVVEILHVPDGASAGRVDVNARRDLLPEPLQFEHVAGLPSLAPDGRTLAMGTVDMDRTPPEGPVVLTFWDVETGEPVEAPLDLPGDASAVAWSADGSRAVVGTWSGEIRILDVDDGVTVATYDVGESVVWVAISDDGTCAMAFHADFAAEDNSPSFSMWNGEADAPVYTSDAGRLQFLKFMSGTTRVPFMVLDRDDRSRELHVIDGRTGEIVHRHDLPGGTGRVHLAPMPAGDRVLVSGGGDGSPTGRPPVRVLNLATGEMEPLAGGAVPAAGPMAVSPDGRTAALVRDYRALDLVSIQSGRSLLDERLQRHSGGVSAMALTADGTLAVTGGAEAGDVRIWDPDTGEPRGVVGAHDGEVTAIRAVPGGAEVLTAGADGAIHRVDASSAEIAATVQSGGFLVTGLALSADGALLVALQEDGSLTLHLLDTNEEVGRIEAPAEDAVDVLFRPGGSDLTVVGESACILVDPFSRNRTGSITWEGQDLRAVAFGPDGDTVVLAGSAPDSWSDVYVEVRTAPGWRLRRQVLVPDAFTTDVAVHPDGASAVVLTAETLVIVPMVDGPVLQVDLDIAGDLGEAVFDADGDRLLVRTALSCAVHVFDWEELTSMARPLGAGVGEDEEDGDGEKDEDGEEDEDDGAEDEDEDGDDGEEDE